MSHSLLRALGLSAIAVFIICGSLSAQAEVSPRIAVVGPDLTFLVGVRGRIGGTALTPYGGIYSRGTTVSYSLIVEPPSGRGLHATLGAHWETGAPDAVRRHVSVGAGVVSWERDDWGEEFVGELEAGLTIPTSDSFGVTLALRLERLAERGTFAGGVLGVAWRVGG
ncbi:MAG: hypothetical protein KJO44_04450 [Gemmatimonadetes bacterium]|nr:hypothetical protein [Gemmatimonadota bacterium]